MSVIFLCHFTEDRDVPFLLPHPDAVCLPAGAGQVGLQRGQGGEVLQHQHRDVPGEAVHHVHGDCQPAGRHGEGDSRQSHAAQLSPTARLGIYSRLPSCLMERIFPRCLMDEIIPRCLMDRIIPPLQITAVEKQMTLRRLTQVIPAGQHQHPDADEEPDHGGRHRHLHGHHQAGVLVSADRPRGQPQSTLVLNSLVMKLCHDRRGLYIRIPGNRSNCREQASIDPSHEVRWVEGGPARLQETADGDPPANADSEGGAACGADHRQGGLLIHVSSLFFAHL